MNFVDEEKLMLEVEFLNEMINFFMGKKKEDSVAIWGGVLQKYKRPPWIPDLFVFAHVIIKLARGAVTRDKWVGSVGRELEFQNFEKDPWVQVRTNFGYSIPLVWKIKDCGIDILEYERRRWGCPIQYWFECRYDFSDEDGFLRVNARMRVETARELMLGLLRSLAVTEDSSVAQLGSG